MTRELSSRRSFLKSSLFTSFALALPISAKPESLVNTKPQPDTVYDTVYNTNGVERMRIYSNGNVGIGTIMPPYELKLKTYNGRNKHSRVGRLTTRPDKR